MGQQTITRRAVARHYGMDWLRIGAFALLILYHVGMVFVPWNFHVKSGHIADWAVWPMLATNAWRLTLLFVVSGYASRALLAREPDAARFAARRSARLLVPLVFGILVIVPPQPWVELVTKHGYDAGYLAFWTGDYLRFGTLAGMVLPAANHLWFVLYLWIYTLVLAVGVALVRVRGTQAAFDHIFAGWRVLVLPTLWFMAVHGQWFVMAAETHALVDDGIAHVSYLPAFLFGFGLAGSPRVLAAAVHWRRPAAALALAGYLGVLAIEAHWGGPPTPRLLSLYGIAHAFEQWGAIVTLIGYAERHWNRDRPIRATLTEAVFPFYLVHQTIIVVVMYWLLPARLAGWAEFAILVAATAGGCLAFYLIGRRIAPLRPLIGLRRHPRVAPSLL